MAGDALLLGDWFPCRTVGYTPFALREYTVDIIYIKIRNCGVLGAPYLLT